MIHPLALETIAVVALHHYVCLVRNQLGNKQDMWLIEIMNVFHNNDVRRRTSHSSNSMVGSVLPAHHCSMITQAMLHWVTKQCN